MPKSTNLRFETDLLSWWWEPLRKRPISTQKISSVAFFLSLEHHFKRFFILCHSCLCLSLAWSFSMYLSLYLTSMTFSQSFGKTRHSLWLLEKKPFSLNFRVYGKGGRLVIGISDPKGTLDEDAIAIKSKRKEFKTNFFDKNQFKIDMISLRYTRLC